ncbi:MAG: dethiobiotin synthase [Candidatus Omnitrophica bacterium]|nr:dethiobiotin synthase [Candidatus Omnitrophota bacterium]
MKRAVFISGTDTGIGKTVVTGLLAKYFQEQGLNVITQKWVQTGSSFSGADIKTHLKIMGRGLSEVSKLSGLISPYVFKLPASPHLAAKFEHKKISSNKIIKSFKALTQKFDIVLVEGVGGALVPVDKKTLLIDIAKKLNIPVLLVCPNKLGAINQAFLTIEAIKGRGFKILGLILIDNPRQNKLILKDNPKIIKRFSGVNILGILPWNKDYNYLYKKFIPAAYKIKKALR